MHPGNRVWSNPVGCTYVQRVPCCPRVGFLSQLLALAEENLQRIRELRGVGGPTRYAATAEAEVRIFYDDYAALLQGWRNLLDRHDLASHRSVASWSGHMSAGQGRGSPRTLTTELAPWSSSKTISETTRRTREVFGLAAPRPLPQRQP